MYKYSSMNQQFWLKSLNMLLTNIKILDAFIQRPRLRRNAAYVNVLYNYLKPNSNQMILISPYQEE